MIKLFETKEEAIKQLPLFTLRKFTIEGNELTIVLTHSGIKVFENKCPHDGASLAAGNALQNDVVVCPLHHYHFDLKTGKCQDFEYHPLQLYEVIENHEGIFISY